MNLNVVFGEKNASFDASMGATHVINNQQNGATFFPNVSPDGVISWTNDRGLENPPPVDIKGENGKTPIKGTDYFTEADKAEMVSDVLAALPSYTGEVEVV